MNINKIFATPVWIENYSVNIELINFCLQLKIDNPLGEQKTNVGGWHSQDIKNNIQIQPLINLLLEDAKYIYNDLGINKNPTLNSIWCNISNKNHYHEIHKHNRCMLSGVFYILKEKEHGDIIFYTEDQHRQEYVPNELVEKWTPQTSSQYKFNLTTGNCIFFPSWLAHGVTPNKTNLNRISISFNFD